jgi:hypothetical protein
MIPPKGSLLRAEAELSVAFRRLWRALQGESLSTVQALVIFWLGLLVGGLAGWYGR